MTSDFLYCDEEFENYTKKNGGILETVLFENEENKTQTEDTRDDLYSDCDEDKKKRVRKEVVITSETYQFVDPFYDRNCLKQKHMNPLIRVLLFDWMMEVSYEFGLTRLTYALACQYSDRFLSYHQHVEQREIQLIGATCLFVAIKAEETSLCRVIDISRITKNSCSVIDILAMERKICQVLKWKFNLPTTENWLMYYLKKWDSFVVDFPGARVSTVFLKSDEIYKPFQELTQLLDLIKMKLSFWKHGMRKTVLSLLYLYLGYDNKVFSKTFILDWLTSQHMFNQQQQAFNEFYEYFLVSETDFLIQDLQDTILFVSEAFLLPLSLKSDVYNSKKKEQRWYLLFDQSYWTDILASARKLVQKDPQMDIEEGAEEDESYFPKAFKDSSKNLNLLPSKTSIHDISSLSLKEQLLYLFQRSQDLKVRMREEKQFYEREETKFPKQEETAKLMLEYESTKKILNHEFYKLNLQIRRLEYMMDFEMVSES